VLNNNPQTAKKRGETAGGRGVWPKESQDLPRDAKRLLRQGKGKAL